MEHVSSQRVPRNPKCARCRNHGFVVALKGHSGHCRFSRCSCWKCALISERTRIMAKQRGIRKLQHAIENGGNAGGNGGGDGEPVSNSRRERDAVHRKTLTELEVAPQTASTDDTEMAQKSSAHSEGAPRDGAPRDRAPQGGAPQGGAPQDGGFSREQPLLPSQYVVTEIPQNPVFSTELPLEMPYHLNAQYAGVFLLHYGLPPLEASGFPHLPQTALTESTEVGPGFFYMPYVYPRPEYYQQYVRERVDMSPLQHEIHSDTREQSE